MPRPRVTTRITVFDPIEQFAPPKDRSPLAQPSSPTASSFGPWNRLKLPPAIADIPLLVRVGNQETAGPRFWGMKGLANAFRVGLILPCALLSGCATMGPTSLISHKSRLSVFAAKKDAVIESRSEEMGTNPVRVSLVSFLELRTLQHARGVEIAVRSGGFPVYVDDDEMLGLLKGVDEICSADVDPT